MISLKQYINNPLGKDNSVFSNRQMYEELYKTKFEKMLIKENGVVQYKLYKTNDDRYYIHFKIPSETVDKMYYDVVFEFDSKVVEGGTQSNIFDRSLRVFSNDPSFMFTFAYSFNKNKLLITELKPKLSKASLEDKAVNKNPKNLVGYVKSFYFAYLIMKKYNINKTILDTYGENFNLHNMMRSISNSKDILEIRRTLTPFKPTKVDIKDINYDGYSNNSKNTNKSSVSIISKKSKISKISKRK